MKRKTLLFVQISTHFKEIWRVALLLQDSPNYEPLILFNGKYEGVQADMDLCRAQGIPYYLGLELVDSKSVPNPIQPKLPVKIFQQVLKKISRLKRLSFLLLFRILVFVKRSISFLKRSFKAFYWSTKTWLKRILQPTQAWINRGILLGYHLLWKFCAELLPSQSKSAKHIERHFLPFLKEKNVEMIIFPEHNLFYFTQLCAHLAKKMNVFSLIIPFTIANTKEWAEAFYDQPPFIVKWPFNQLFAHGFPQWLLPYKDRLLMMHPEIILIHELYKIRPAIPWLINSGEIDLLAAESPRMKEYYLSAGINPSNIRITGSLYDDIIFQRLQHKERYRSDLYKNIGLSETLPILLCALPPDQFVSRPHAPFCSYAQFLQAFLQQLTPYAKKYHILLNLHPRLNKKWLETLKSYPVHVVSQNIAELIPLSDIYIASASATIRLAISCGIPVINYDFYDYRYDDFSQVKGVLTISKPAQFVDVLDKLLTNKEFFQGIKFLQEHEKQYWGCLHGQVGKNLLAAMDSFFVEHHTA